jgi:hypothetical protein
MCQVHNDVTNYYLSYRFGTESFCTTETMKIVVAHRDYALRLAHQDFPCMGHYPLSK